MISAEITSVSSKGQVVIPGKIRKSLGLSAGAKLIVLTDGNNLLLKRLEEPKIEAFKNLVAASRKLAKQKGLKKSDLPGFIRKARHESRS